MVILSYEVRHSSGRLINVGGNFLEAIPETNSSVTGNFLEG